MSESLTVISVVDWSEATPVVSCDAEDNVSGFCAVGDGVVAFGHGKKIKFVPV